VIYGLVTASNTEIYQRSLGINVDLYWGLLLLVFGGWMLAMAWRGSQGGKPNEPGQGPGPKA